MPLTSQSNRLFWGVLLLIVAAAAVPRLLIYDFSLPYIDHPDEPNKYLAALEWRGQYNNSGYYNGNPPAYIAVHYVLQSILEAAGQLGLANAVWVLRLVSVIADLITIVLIALIARLAANAGAGWVAAVAWAVNPLVLENNVYALPDPLIVMLGTLALWFALQSLCPVGRMTYAVWSVIAGLVATLLKYPALPLVMPGIVAVVLTLTRERRKAIQTLAGQTMLVLGTLVWLFFIYGIDVEALNVNERAVIRDSGFSNVVQPGRIWNNVYFAFYPLTLTGVAVIVLGAAAYIAAAWRGTQRVDWRAALLGLSLLFMPWLAASYTQVDAVTRMRDVLPATAGLAVILGMSVAQLGYTLSAQQAWMGQLAATAALTVFVFLPQIAVDVEQVQLRRLPDTRVAIRQWADVNLEAGTVVVDQTNHKTFNPYWGGIEGRQWFDWWLTDDFTAYPLAEWRDERGMSYMAVPVELAADLPANYTDNMLMLRRFDPPGPVRGPRIAFYRLWRMEHDLDVAFGEAIRLVGYDSPTSAQRGDAVTLRFYWQADATPAANYSFYVHLTPADSREVIAQADGAPAVPERPTVTWQHPSEVLLSPELTLNVPADLPAGDYRVIVGLYDFNTFERLPVAQGDLGDGYALLRFTVRE